MPSRDKNEDRRNRERAPPHSPTAPPIRPGLPSPPTLHPARNAPCPTADSIPRPSQATARPARNFPKRCAPFPAPDLRGPGWAPPSELAQAAERQPETARYPLPAVRDATGSQPRSCPWGQDLSLSHLVQFRWRPTRYSPAPAISPPAPRKVLVPS